ncbi:MAG TPA: DUF521 domain-containing protein [Candidatus Aenigmarchaeota archaeon]|nr:DUF521 domain-containing protein [Candidatus Aenigmarchaeota archaeon]
MYLTKEEERMLNGEFGFATQKAMEILVALGKIYDAERLIRVSSVQVAGVSYKTIGEAGLEFIEDMAKDGRVRVKATLNPAGIDLKDWRKFGFPEDFAEKQLRIIKAYERMGIEITCTCTPYLIGNLPKEGEHVAWSESSAVTYANSILGARTNREGGPSALAAALTGRTPLYGLHLDEERIPDVLVEVKTFLRDASDFGALGYLIGEFARNKIAFIKGIKKASVEELKSLSASTVTYGSKPLFYIEKITPGWDKFELPKEKTEVTEEDLREAREKISDYFEEPDFVCIGCPHTSIEEIKKIANFLKNKEVRTELWIATSRKVKETSDKLSYTEMIENAGGKIICDTCMVVAPLENRFKALLTNSAKACYYCRSKMKVKLASLKECLEAATR